MQTALVNHDLEIIYWNILKAGHSSIQMFLIEHGFEAEVKEWNLPEAYANFSVVREPLSRYFSAVYTMWMRQEVEIVEYLANILKYNKQHPQDIWTCGDDQHFAPQKAFLPDRYIRLFALDNLNGQVLSYLKELGVESDTEFGNEREMDPFFREAVEEMVTDDDIQCIIDKYRYDITTYVKALMVVMGTR